MKSLHIDWLGLVFVLVWSSGYIVGSIATSHIAPLTVTLWRFLLAAVVLAVIARRRHERWPRGRSELPLVVAAGVLLFAVQFSGLYIGLSDGMPAATTALIACSAPLLVAVAAAALKWERLIGRQWTGVLLGVTGVVITLADRVGRPPSAVALAWTLVGLLGLAGGSLLQSRLGAVAGPAALASTQVLAATAVLAVWAPSQGSLTVPLTATAVTSYLWLAIVTGVGAPLLFFTLIRQRGAPRATSLLFLVPAVTALAGWPVLGKPVGPTAVIGLAVAGAGLWLARRTPVLGGDRQLALQEPDRRRPRLRRGLLVMEHRHRVVEGVPGARIGLELHAGPGHRGLDPRHGAHGDVVVGQSEMVQAGRTDSRS
jgi:drug/metabolite transporter (DMT)-like permease